MARGAPVDFKKLQALFSRLISATGFRWLLGLTISLLSLFLALRQVTPVDLAETLRRFDWRYLLLALASVAVNVWAKVHRWRLLLGPEGQQIGWGYLAAALLAGQALNLVYPARMGDLSRVYVVGGKGVGRTFTLGTVVIEKLLDTIGYAVVLVLFVFLTLTTGSGAPQVAVPVDVLKQPDIIYPSEVILPPVPLEPVAANSSGWISQLLDSQVLPLALAGLALGLIPLAHLALKRIPQEIQRQTQDGASLFFLWLPLTWRAPLTSRLKTLLRSLAVLRHPGKVFILAAWTLVAWATAALNNHLVALALGLHLPITASLLVLLALMAGISLPAAPGRVGLFQYICILALSAYGVSQATAFGYGIVLHLVVMGPTTLAGLLAIGLWGTTR